MSALSDATAAESRDASSIRTKHGARLRWSRRNHPGPQLPLTVAAMSAGIVMVMRSIPDIVGSPKFLNCAHSYHIFEAELNGKEYGCIGEVEAQPFTAEKNIFKGKSEAGAGHPGNQIMLASRRHT